MANSYLNPDDPRVLRVVVNQIKTLSRDEWIERLREYPDFATADLGAAQDIQTERGDRSDFPLEARQFIENA